MEGIGSWRKVGSVPQVLIQTQEIKASKEDRDRLDGIPSLG